MRYIETGGVDYSVAEEQYVEVDQARPFDHRALTAHFLFDSEQPRQKLAREKRGLRRHHLVQEPGLIDDLARRGFVDGLRARETHMWRCDLFPRLQQVRDAVP